MCEIRAQMKPVIVWFRQDLRLADNPALHAAAASGAPLICLFILDDKIAGDWKWGGASRWWLHHSLAALDKSLKGKLVLRKGDAATIIKALVKESGADKVMWNRCYEPFAVERDKALKAGLGDKAHSFNGALLHEPWELKTGAGTPFRVFTPFWKAMRARDVDKALPAPRALTHHPATGDVLADWKLLPTHPNWAKGFDWTPGEKAAQDALYEFLDGVDDYGAARDLPDRDGTSRLSPHLHWGEISPRQIWHAWAGGNSAPSFCSTIRRFPKNRWTRASPNFAGGAAKRISPPGPGGRPAFPSSMPGCASFGRPAGCTTG
jgi:deoxyribodipyrimidine photo-lyase